MSALDEYFLLHDPNSPVLERLDEDYYEPELCSVCGCELEMCECDLGEEDLFTN